MKTLSIPNPHRTLMAALLAAALVLIAPKAPPIQWGNIALSPVVTTSVPARPMPPARPITGLPFAMRDVVVFLTGNFQLQPVESGPDFAKFIYAEPPRDGTSAEIMRIAVRERAEQIQAVFTFREFNAMHYVAEFIESPLFTRSESEQIYGLLYTPKQVRSWQKVGRFYARAGLLDVAEGTEASFEFAANPPRR